MERSGEIADVLEVSRELSNVRESIERIDAQQQTLKRRVAYSHIYLTLNSPTVAVAPLRPAGETLGNTWQAATRSVKAFTLGGLKVGLWLLAYSPYLALVVLLALGGYRLRRPRPVPAAEGGWEPGLGQSLLSSATSTNGGQGAVSVASRMNWNTDPQGIGPTVIWWLGTNSEGLPETAFPGWF